ncbi:MAG: hypothetical protein CL938_16660 [Deltaproteobacteria bacterium]|nr:hypothetical protein [Deltaproteobacteria bacterium]
MRLIIINDFAEVRGGSDKVVIETVVGWSELGVEVDFVFGGSAVDDRLLGIPGVTLHGLQINPISEDPNRLRAMVNGLWNRQVYASVLALIAERKRQGETVVVHIHCFSKTLSMAVFAAARAEGVICLHTLHDYFAFSPNGVHFDFRAYRILDYHPLSWRTLLHNPDRRSYWHHVYRVFRTALQFRTGLIPEGVDRFIAVSGPSAEFARKYLPEEKVTRIGYPLERPSVQQYEPARQQEVGYVGRISADKGIFLLADAARRANCRLRIVGDGPDREKLVSSYPEVTVTGWRTGDEFESELRRLRVIVLPSLWPETFGLATVEGMARGIPTMVSRLAGSSEMISPGKNGWILSELTVEAIANELIATKDSNLVANFGREARATVDRLESDLFSHLAKTRTVIEESIALRNAAD